MVKETHQEILSAIRALADYEPLTVSVQFRGYNVVRMDAYDVRAHKVGRSETLIVQWDDLTPVEALLLKKACRYPIAWMQVEAEMRLTQITKLRESFGKSPFDC